MNRRRSVHLIVTLMMISCMLFSVFVTSGADPAVLNPYYYAEFINTKDDSKYYVLLLGKNPAGGKDWIVTTSMNRTEGQAEIRNAYSFKEAELGVPGYVTDGVDTVLSGFNGFDGFVYDKDMSGLQCCWGDSVINYHYIHSSEDAAFRFLIYWPDSGNYKLSETFQLKKSERVRIDMSEEKELLPVTDLEYAYGLNAVLPGLAAHLGVTVLVEVLVALFFKLRTKKQLTAIVLTSALTNLAADSAALLSLMHYMRFYILFELAVFVMGFIVYRIVLSKDIKTGRLLIYSAAANLISAAAGFFAFMAVLLSVGIT